MLGRRRTLAVLGGAGIAAFIGSGNETVEADTIACAPSTPQVTEGPYWVDEKLLRSDIRTDPATGVARPGLPLALSISIQNSSGSSCVPLVGALVDIWHCDAIGIYSDEPAYNPGGGTGTVITSGQKFLRGYQITDDAGQVQFSTIYPGWYSGRTIHIHVRVRTLSGSTVPGNFVTQLFFDEAVNNEVLAQAPYSNRTSSRDTTNARDNVYSPATNASRMLLTLTRNSSGYAGAIMIATSLHAPAVASPSITAGGIANAASGAAGLTPGSWISIYGSNLASAPRGMTATDVINNALPASLGGVSVQINGKAAYMNYVSPTLINVLSPDDTSSGPVAVTVTNAAGTSAAVSATMQPILPGLFTLSSYLRAVRWPDGVIINGTGAAEIGYASAAAAKPGDVLEIYGTGFGPAPGAIAVGVVFQGAYAALNPVTVGIGDLAAPVSWAGLVGPGLYLINATVPTGLANGDHPVIATVGGNRTQSGALLKIAS